MCVNKKTDDAFVGFVMNEKNTTAEFAGDKKRIALKVIYFREKNAT